MIPVGPGREELSSIVDFLLEIDRLKGVERRNFLADDSRRENTAEHSWHLGVAVALLAPFAPGPVDVATAITMALLHDIVEIDAGDTFAYDEAGAVDKRAREELAADRLFGMLPDETGRRWRALWEDYEAGTSAEAKLVMAVDRMAPMLLNTAGRGTAWAEAGITRGRVERRNQVHVLAGLPELWPLLAERLDRCVADGRLADG